MICRSLLVAAVVAWSTSSAFAKEALVEMESEGWKYHDGVETPAEDWYSAEFDDSEWESGQAPLGYGDKHIHQELSYGDDKSNKPICVYIRRTVNLDAAPDAKQLLAEFICDDGCVIFVNGEEVIRHNLPDGELTETTTAPITCQGAMEQHKFKRLIDPTIFKAGKNSIAARVHQRSKMSSDLSFDVSITTLTTDEEVEDAKAAVDEEQERIKQALQSIGQ